jgi:prepilin signal peptidase PulO-like enzyme (type II secretory pathway)
MLYLHTGRTAPFALLLLTLIAIFGYIAAILDIKTKRIPNGLILMMLASWIMTMVPKLFFDTAAAITLLGDSTLGFLIGGGLFLLVYMLSRKGLGGGDVKFMAAAGLYLGFGGTISTMLYGTVIAALTGGILILSKKIGRKETIPLAPFLYIGILLTIFFQ